MKKVMVFGVFDGLHEGHKSFLRSAKALGDYLIVVVATDNTVESLKSRSPLCGLGERMEEVGNLKYVDEVRAGDSELGKWSAVLELKPDVVAFGYDQAEPRDALSQKLAGSGLQPEIVTLSAHEPKKYKCSIINKQD